MEIKVKCRKEGDTWHIDDPGEVFVTENRVVWTFQGIEPGVVPLLDFTGHNQPFGPFPRGWLTASTITAELEELPASRATHDYDLMLVQWNPDRSHTLVTRPHQVTIVPPETVPIMVSWPGSGDVKVDPEVCKVGGARLVEWQFEIPDNVFASIDFGSSSPGAAGEPRPMGPFAELHGRRGGGVYRVTGQTDLREASYQYTITLYNRETGEIVRHDPQIDNNGVPPGQPEAGGGR